MSNTYSQIYIQAVWAVKYRDAVLEKPWRDDFFSVVASLINKTGCKAFIVNGVEDHIHCFFSMPAKLSVSQVMKEVKSLSSKHLNETKILDHRFEWQRGFGAFSYSKSSVKNVFRYIQNQEEHHKKQGLLPEYIDFLQRFEVDYDEVYLFDDLI